MTRLKRISKKKSRTKQKSKKNNLKKLSAVAGLAGVGYGLYGLYKMSRGKSSPAPEHKLSKTTPEPPLNSGGKRIQDRVDVVEAGVEDALDTRAKLLIPDIKLVHENVPIKLHDYVLLPGGFGFGRTIAHIQQINPDNIIIKEIYYLMRRIQDFEKVDENKFKLIDYETFHDMGFTLHQRGQEGELQEVKPSPSISPLIRSTIKDFVNKRRINRIKKDKILNDTILLSSGSPLDFSLYVYNQEYVDKHSESLENIPYAHFIQLGVILSDPRVSRFSYVYKTKKEKKADDSLYVTSLPPSLMELCLEYSKAGLGDYKCLIDQIQRHNLYIFKDVHLHTRSITNRNTIAQIENAVRKNCNKLFNDLIQIALIWSHSTITPDNFLDLILNFEFENSITLPTLSDCVLYRGMDRNISNDSRQFYYSPALATSFHKYTWFTTKSWGDQVSMKRNNMSIYIPPNMKVKCFPIFLFGDKGETEVVLLDVFCMRDPLYDDHLLIDSEYKEKIGDFKSWVVTDRGKFETTVEHKKLNTF